MGTCAITFSLPINIATSKNKTQPILAFNQEGLIDVFIFDHIPNHIPLTDWANANILYHICQQLCLMPGQSEADDKIIIAYLIEALSPNILNKGEVAFEICDSWNKIAKESAKTYDNFKESISNTALEYQGAYELSFNDYCANILSTNLKIESWYYLQAAELIQSTLHGRAFSKNPYLQRMALTSLGEACAKDILSFQKTYLNIVREQIVQNNAEWFTNVQGLVEFEIHDLLTSTSKNEFNIKDVRIVLNELLNNKIPSPDASICEVLTQTISLKKSPLTHLKLPADVTADQIMQVIEYVIEKNIRQASFVLKFPTSTPFEILRLARSNAKEDKNVLVNKLLSDNPALTPTLLHAILNQSKDLEIKEVVSGLLEKNTPEKLINSPIFEPIFDLLQEATRERQKKLEKQEKKQKKEHLRYEKSKRREKFERQTRTRFSFWSKLTTILVFSLIASAMIGSSGFTTILMSLFGSAAATFIFNIGLNALFVKRNRYFATAQEKYNIKSLDNINDPDEIEALQIGVNATDGWNYTRSYFQLRAYTNYKAFLGGYCPAMQGDNDVVQKIKALKVP